MAVAKNGDIYWTDSASDFALYDGIYVMLANPSGRLFRYNRQTKKNVLIADQLYFANGIALSPDEEFVVVSETAASRLSRYYIKGSKAGTSDVFIDRLPGASDNLTPDANGIWVPLVMAIDAEHPALWQSAANAPYIRRFLCRILALIEAPFKLVERFYPNPYSQWVVNRVGHFETLAALTPPRTTILRIDWTGKIVGSLHGFDRSVQTVAHVLEDGDYLYLGSFSNKYLGRVALPKTYKSAAQQQAKPGKFLLLYEPNCFHRLSELFRLLSHTHTHSCTNSTTNHYDHNYHYNHHHNAKTSNNDHHTETSHNYNTSANDHYEAGDASAKNHRQTGYGITYNDPKAGRHTETSYSQSNTNNNNNRITNENRGLIAQYSIRL